MLYSSFSLLLWFLCSTLVFMLHYVTLWSYDFNSLSCQLCCLLYHDSDHGMSHLIHFLIKMIRSLISCLDFIYHLSFIIYHFIYHLSFLGIIYYHSTTSIDSSSLTSLTWSHWIPSSFLHHGSAPPLLVHFYLYASFWCTVKLSQTMCDLFLSIKFAFYYIIEWNPNKLNMLG